MDNLNTHSIASLYATFPPQYARDLVERLEIHYTPKHGSWLDIAEIELSALGRQCIANNRIPDLSSLRNLLKPWAVARNIAQKGVDWHFTTDDARTRLKHLYPIVKIQDLHSTNNNQVHAYYFDNFEKFIPCRDDFIKIKETYLRDKNNILDMVLYGNMSLDEVKVQFTRDYTG